LILAGSALALAIAGISYLLLIFDRFDRSLIAMLGGCAMIVLGVMNQEQAIQGIDFNTLALLAGTMVIVSIAQRSGLFEYLAVWSAQAVRASPWGMLLAIALVTAFLSSLLNNATTVLLIAPVALSITRHLEVPPFPFLLSIAMASNIGGTATLIGDPPNIMIGSAAHLGFDDFLIHVAPPTLVVLAFQCLAMHVLFGRAMRATEEARGSIMRMRAKAKIVDSVLLWQSVSVLALTVLGLAIADKVGLEPGTVALIGGAVLLLLHSHGHHREHRTRRVTETYGEVDWITLFFFIGLFMIVHGVETTGLMDRAAQALAAFTGGQLASTGAIILWSAAFLSAIVDNIPFVAAMIPVIKSLEPAVGGAAAVTPLWWALSLGACLGGNATLIGAAANLTAAGIAEKNGVRFTFLGYMRYAAPLTIVHVAIAHLYLWLRYF
jgi:Na+/H+ antiporter NhaD/arsenite permease-like protein